jgi:uncharacterized protein YbbC (DUF1343 family)
VDLWIGLWRSIRNIENMTASRVSRFLALPGFLLFLPLLVWSCGNPSDSGNGTKGGIESLPHDTLQAKVPAKRVVTGAERLISEKLNTVRGKKVGIVANHTSLVFDGTHLVDSLHSLGINVVRVFAPEHGFRGDQDAGKHIANGKDSKTGIPIASLYGNNKKPSANLIKDLDLVLFDIQDVGARFYTYISTMSYVMEACAEQEVPVIVLDRPNPNGWYVEGPVLESKHSSFIGMHEVPVAHGMTVGEYARMVNGEGWLKNDVRCLLDVITASNYTHSMKWDDTGLPWVAPSPNLPTEYSAYLYPMLCWMEGMSVSIGRGTDHPFEQFGAPWHMGYRYQIRKDSVNERETPSEMALYGLELEYLAFTPISMPGKSTDPKYKGQECFGARFTNRVDGKSLFMAGISLLKNLQEESKIVNLGVDLYRPSFNLLLGNSTTKEQIKKQVPDQQIYDSWQSGKNEFLVKRRKYLLYQE